MLRREGNWAPWRRDLLVRGSGGLVDPTGLGAFDRTSCALLRDLFVETRKRHQATYYGDRFGRMSLFYVENVAANALALERGRDRGIGVFLGLPRRLWAAFHIGLSNPAFLDGCFDSEPGPLIGDASVDLLRGGELLFIPDEIWPEERTGALWDLFERALTFLLCHEISHHVRGHLELVRDRLGFDGVDELRGAAADGPDNRLLRLIEFDADSDAVDLILISVVADAAAEGWSADKTRAQGFQWMVAVITVFLIFDLEHLPVSLQYESSHPAPVHRAILTAGAFSRTFARNFAWSEEERALFEESAWEAVSEIAEQLELPPGRWCGETTSLMDLGRYAEEEKLFLEFEAWISASASDPAAVEPAWLRA